MKRFPFLDWMRGLAVVVMIQCHVFNSLTRLDLRVSGTYIMSQFIGGMAAPLFLFMAGMTFAFQMESLDRRQLTSFKRWSISLWRASYILGIAYLFRFTNWLFTPRGDWHEITRVDILNCMGLAMIVMSAAAVFQGGERIRFVALAGVAIAAAAPVVANLPWGETPLLIQQYVAAGPGRGRFPFFPCAAYVAFGLATGSIVRRTGEDNLDRTMQWAAMLGLALIFTSQYFATIPFSLYTKSSFWVDSPALVFIRVGVTLLLMGLAYLWTAFRSNPGWSWIACLGKSSLLVYWVHVMLVYGGVAVPLKRTFEIGESALATLLVTLAMVGLAAAWQWDRLKPVFSSWKLARAR